MMLKLVLHLKKIGPTLVGKCVQVTPNVLYPSPKLLLMKKLEDGIGEDPLFQDL